MVCGRSAPAGAEDANPSASDLAASGQSKEDEIDRLLDLNLEQLSQVPVSVIDPLVEGISKKPENLSESPGVAQVITAEQIRAYGAKNLFEVLNWATSV